MLKRAGALRLAITSGVLALFIQTTSVPATASTQTHITKQAQSAQSTRNQKAYAAAWESIQQNYCDRTKLDTWDGWRHKFDGKLDSEGKLQAALDDMLHSLSDDYTFCLTEKDIRSSEKERKQPNIVDTRIMPGNIGYLKLDNFSSRGLGSQMKKSLQKLSRTDGIVLDLRNNHGGYIAAAQEIFSMLVDSGQFMSFQGFLEGKPDNQTAILQRHHWKVLKNNQVTTERRSPNLIGNKPLLVLVNEDTRSASEMLAGALRDNGRAMVIGKQTYGKGVLQDTFRISDRHAVKVVTARYFLPLGSNIHEKGLAPDIELSGSSQAQLNRAAQLLSSAITEAHSSGRRVLAVIEQTGARL